MMFEFTYVTRCRCTVTTYKWSDKKGKVSIHLRDEVPLHRQQIPLNRL